MSLNPFTTPRVQTSVRSNRRYRSRTCTHWKDRLSKSRCEKCGRSVVSNIGLGTPPCSTVGECVVLQKPHTLTHTHTAQLLNYLFIPTSVCSEVQFTVAITKTYKRPDKKTSEKLRAWARLILTAPPHKHKHTPRPGRGSHQCRFWSRWCEICPCKTPLLWWQTWRWRRTAAGRSAAREPWLSLWTSTPPGDLKDDRETDVRREFF